MSDWTAADLEAFALGISDALAEAAPGVAFAVLTFDVGDAGSVAYASTVHRRDMIAALEDLIERLREEP